MFSRVQMVAMDDEMAKLENISMVIYRPLKNDLKIKTVSWPPYEQSSQM